MVPSRTVICDETADGLGQVVEARLSCLAPSAPAHLSTTSLLLTAPVSGPAAHRRLPVAQAVLAVPGGVTTPARPRTGHGLAPPPAMATRGAREPLTFRLDSHVECNGDTQ